jgi:pilus assembly protein Flp/PilA
MPRFIRRFLDDESGATVIEYGLIAALIFLVILTSVTVFGNESTSLFSKSSEALVAAMGG